MKENIERLIKERNSYWEAYEDSWDSDDMEYKIPEPKEVDKLGSKIRKLINIHADKLEVDFILESLTKLGQAPQVVYDDNGHFAISSSGFGPVVTTESGKFDDRESFTTIVEPEEWKDTIREALNYYLKS